MLEAWKDKLALLGPGLLYAGAAVGVSHLVQSTRAGAEFGLQLLGIIILVNIIKYPIFESGPRYAAATGKTLLDGYQGIGKWAVWIYAVMSILSMFIIMAAISIVTAGLFAYLTSIEIEAVFVAIILLAISVFILGVGHYTTLDKMMKFIIVLLSISTVFAITFGLIQPSIQQPELMQAFDFGDRMNVLFLVALIGWMPAPIDISIWHSVWSVSKNKERGKRLTMRESLTDFNIGYWGTTFLACCFLGLGALVMYGTPEKPSASSVEFAGQLINLYTLNLGQWAFPFIALAAFTTMFSTLLTCLDAFPRTLRKSTKLTLPFYAAKKHHNGLYWFWLIITAMGTSLILLFFLSDMRAMVDLATTLSFVVAPVFATLNFLAMNANDIPAEARQSKFLRFFNIGAIVLLYIFSIWFLIY